jgi:pimeloyl-ACP methyl ester carboxylesterase
VAGSILDRRRSGAQTTRRLRLLLLGLRPAIQLLGAPRQGGLLRCTLAAEGTDLYLTREGIRTAFAADVPRRTADLMFATQRPFAEEAFGSPSGPPAWKSIPSWYLVASEDRAIPPATQRFMAERAGAQTAEVRASHVAHISRPKAVTRIILEAAESLN